MTGGATGADNVVVGLVIFSIIVLIQFVVITKGATRISEVAARFTLDGMPGKQMAIDADLNAGVIDQHEAQRRRREVGQQADFFGAMDGASKFVRGDAIAGIAIILINIIGGLFIGIVENGMSPGPGRVAVHHAHDRRRTGHTSAGISDFAGGGHVGHAQQPGEQSAQASFCGNSSRGRRRWRWPVVFWHFDLHQLAEDSAAVDRHGPASGMAITLSRRETKVQAAQAKKQADTSRRTQNRVEDYLAVDPMELELGVGLLRLADPKRGGDLLERIQRMRQNMAAEIGIILPKVRVRDNMRLEPNQYRIKIADMAVAQGTIDGTTPRAGRHADRIAFEPKRFAAMPTNF